MRDGKQDILRNDMRNRDKITFPEITSGSYAFLWQVVDAGYELVKDTYEVVKSLRDDDLKGCEDLTGPWLLPKGPITNVQMTRYAPLSRATLHREFARLNGDQSVIDFVNKYGFLGAYGVPLTSRGGGSLVIGESLTRWKLESCQMACLLAVWDMVKKENAGALGRFIKWVPDGQTVKIEYAAEYDQTEREWDLGPWSQERDKSRFRASSFLIASAQLSPELLTRWRRGDMIGPAKYFVMCELNARLMGHVNPQFHYKDGDIPPSTKDVYLVPDSLLGALNILFLQEMAGPLRLRRCDRCGEWKEIKLTRDTFYCSSACKQAAYRKRKAAGKGGTA